VLGRYDSKVKSNGAITTRKWKGENVSTVKRMEGGVGEDRSGFCEVSSDEVIFSWCTKTLLRGAWG